MMTTIEAKNCFFGKTCKDYNTGACNAHCYPFTELYGLEPKPELRIMNKIKIFPLNPSAILERTCTKFDGQA
jgi:hypothetical protein